MIKSISVTILLYLGITQTQICLAEDLPAESLVIKGFNLGMSYNECKNLSKSMEGHINCHNTNNEITIFFDKEAFGDKDLEIDNAFIKSFMDTYKIQLYFSKIGNINYLNQDHYKEFNELISEPSYCLVQTPDKSALNLHPHLECKNKITGLRLGIIYNGGSKPAIYISKSKTSSDIEKEKREKELKKQEAAKSVKFD